MPTAGGFSRHFAAALSQLIPSNLAAYNEVNLARTRLIALADRPAARIFELVPAWEKYSGQHPLVRYTAESGDGQAMKISDFLSVQEFHRLDLYRAFFKQAGAEDQMAVTVRSVGGVLISFAFNRSRRNFTETDRTKLNLVRPHLIQAYANVVELAGQTDERQDLESALRESGHGMIALRSGSKIAHATPGAVEALRRFFPDTLDPADLPEPITEWLADGGRKAFSIRSGAAVLMVRSPSSGSRRLLLLSEENRGLLPAGVRLTSRERDVLDWLVEGKTNCEIATILGTAAGTVKLHVQHILAKLGAENRTTAAMLVRQGSVRVVQTVEG